MTNVINERLVNDYSLTMLATSPNLSQTSAQRQRRWNPATVVVTCAMCARPFGSKAEADQHMNSAHRGEILRICQRAFDSAPKS